MTATDADEGRLREVVREALEAGIDAAHPDAVLAEALSFEDGVLTVGDDRLDLESYEEVVVLGGGNAAGQVASHLADRLGDYLDGGVVVTDDPAPAGPVDVIEGTHPIPDERNREATARLLQRTRALDEDALVLGVVTGGGSALLPAPADGISLADLQDLTDELLRSGAPIERINAVRKHVSSLKGGQLARAASPARVVGLVFSDVASGDLSVIASGPLSADHTTYDDALATLAEYDVDAPDSVERHLQEGAAGERMETPVSDDPAFEGVSTHVLADGFTAISAASDVCANAGFEPLILSSSVRGEAREAAKTHVAVAEEVARTGNPIEPPASIVSGGETTVTITGDGTGGPNQEFALSAAIELSEGAVLGTVDTDGIDGPTDAAGAIVTRKTVEDTRSASAALAANDAYAYFQQRNALVVTGRTGTNVNDLRVLLIR